MAKQHTDLKYLRQDRSKVARHKRIHSATRNDVTIFLKGVSWRKAKRAYVQLSLSAFGPKPMKFAEGTHTIRILDPDAEPMRITRHHLDTKAPPVIIPFDEAIHRRNRILRIGAALSMGGML